MAFKLAELFCEFTTRGLDVVQKGLGTLHTQLQQVQAGMEVTGRAATLAFGAAGASLGMLVRSGVAASSMGDALHFQFDRLARTVAGIFRPQLEGLLNGLRAVTEWFQSLSQAQLENINRWTMAAAAGLAVAMVLPKIIGGVALLVNGLRALTAALAATGIGALLPILGAVATAFAGIAVGTEVAENGFGGIFEALKPVFEAVVDFAGRVAEALKPILDVAARVFKALWEAVQPVLPALMQMVTIIGTALAQAFGAMEPALTALAQAFGAILQALAPLLPILGELIAAFARVLTPVLQIIAVLLTAIFRILQPIIEVFVKLAEVLLTIVKPVLDVIAFVLDKIARALAFLFGVDLDKQKKAVDALAGSVKKVKDFGPLAPKISGFEALDAAWARISQVSVGMTSGQGKPVAERQVDLQMEANQKLGDIHGAIREGKPLWNK